MADASRRADAKPSRGGVENAMFLSAAAETLPGLLAGMADAITVNYPWGSLLRAVALPDVDTLAKISALAKAGAKLSGIVNVYPLRDAVQARRLGLSDATLLRDEAALRQGYARAGLDIVRVCRIADDNPAAPATSWGSHLAISKREVWRIEARATPQANDR
jgi:16S rRNA (adenine(1408)-N(1))-methyltransferase